MCRTGNFNLSYDSLTGFEARQTLHNLKTTDPNFWNELTQNTAAEVADISNVDMPEDEDDGEVLFEDDSDIPCEAIIACVIGSKPRAGVSSTPDGNLMSTAAAESLDKDETEGDTSEVALAAKHDLGRGKRKITKNRQYGLFWRHNDEDPSDCEEEDR
jgi:hypothetical protein